MLDIEKMPSVSVIIPIHNVEKYLPRALESLVNQTFKDIEIICVDDGSTDRSGDICESFAFTDNRIKVIHQENKRAGVARNVGLAVATGKYIAFMDGDDWLHPNFLEVLYRLCEENQCDIAQCGFSMVWSEKDITVADYCEAVIVKGTDMAIRNYLASDGWRNILVWSKIYRRELLSDIKFPYEKWHEDEFFTYKALWKANRVALTECPLYYYRQRNDSFMGIGFTINKTMDNIEALEEKVAFFKGKKSLLHFLANSELKWHLQNYLKQLEEEMPEREDIKILLENKLQAVQASFKTIDSIIIRKKKKNNIDKYRLRNMQNLSCQRFELEHKYNQSNEFKPGVKQMSGKTVSPKVSVCIPVFNVDRFIGKCLDSVINQTLQDIEIICVEDSSSDDSKDILESYAARDARIRIIYHDKNLGTLISRNDAVMAAQGQYIMFVDGDDELFPDACKTAFNVIKQNQTDMAEFGVQVFESSGKIKNNYFAISDVDRIEDRNLLYLRMKGYLKNWQVWNKIYRADLFKKALQDIGEAYSVFAEDFLEFYVFSYFAKSVSMISEVLYKWRWGFGIWSGIGSIIPLIRFKKILTSKDNLDAVVRCIDSKSDPGDCQILLRAYHDDFLKQTILWWLNNLEDKDKEEGFRLLAEKWGDTDTMVGLKNCLLASKDELDAIKNSNGYKALKKYYGIKEYFLR